MAKLRFKIITLSEIVKVGDEWMELGRERKGTENERVSPNKEYWELLQTLLKMETWSYYDPK